MGCLFSCGGEDTDAVGLPQVEMSVHGPELLVSGTRVRGSGTALASASIEQDAAYWELHVTKAGGRLIWGISKAIKRPQLKAVLNTQSSGDGLFVLDSASGDLELDDGDVLGVAVQQSDLPMLKFFRNGAEIPDSAVSRFRGTMFPAVSVSGGVEVRVAFDAELWKHAPASGRYEPLMCAQSLI